MTVDLDLRVFHDGYKERIEALINSKMKGEVARVEGRTEAVGACLSCSWNPNIVLKYFISS